MNVNIRQAVPADLPQLEAMRSADGRGASGRPLISIEEIRTALEDGRVVVAAEPEAMLGYALEGEVFVVEWRRSAGIGQALRAALGLAEAA